MQEYSFVTIEKSADLCYTVSVSSNFASKRWSLLAVGTYNNEIEQFIYTLCYRPMWEAAYTYIAEHPYALNLSYSRIQNPDSAMLEDMILEYTKNIRIDEDSLLFDAVVSCTINLTEDTYKNIAQNKSMARPFLCGGRNRQTRICYYYEYLWVHLWPTSQNGWSCRLKEHSSDLIQKGFG